MKSQESAFRTNKTNQDFDREVLLQLGEMLKALKQGDTKQQRQQFQSCCQHLIDLGKEAKLGRWVALLQAALSAIADGNNSYQNTAKRIIKEVKHAKELVITERGDEIEISHQLQTLAKKPAPTLEWDWQESPTVWQEPDPKDETQVDLQDDFWSESEPQHTLDEYEDWSNADDDLISFLSEDASEADSESGLDLFSADEPLAELSEELISTDEPLAELGEELSLEDSPENDLLEFLNDGNQPSLTEVETDPLDELATLLDLDSTEEEELNLDLAAEFSLEATDASVSETYGLGLDLEKPFIQAPAVGLVSSKTAGQPCYEQFEQLDFLLEQPASGVSAQVISGTSLEELEAWLESDSATPPSQPASSSTVSTADKELDEFKDLEQLLGADHTGTASPANAQRQPQASQAKVFEQTMRVPVKQLDSLNNLIGELVVNRNSLEQDQERLRQFLDNLLNHVQHLNDIGGRMQDLYERSLLEGALLASRGGQFGASAASASSEDEGFNALEMDRFTGFHLLSQEMIELIVRVRESTSDIQFLVDENDKISRTLRQVTSQLQEGLNTSRMVPFSQTADRLPRAIREVSRRMNKQAELQVEGREVLVDKMILEQLYNPMTHLVNNAISHGIEPPEIREHLGKLPAGRIRVKVFLQGNQTVISVADDGAGINPERVKAKAIEKGLISAAEAKALSNQDIYEFLFHPGFSTKDQADDFAGRGVGMDVVRTNLDAIRGTISIDSSLGKGTTFTIRLPLTLSICKALCCLNDHSRVAFPMDGVEDMQDFVPADIQTDADGRKCIPWRNTLLPFRPLNKLLSYNRLISRGSVYGGTQEEETIAIVVLRGAGSLLAVQVDQVLGEQEIVIKQLEGPVPKPAGVAGATVLGDGSVMPIGDVLELIDIAQGRRSIETSSSLWQRTAIRVQAEAMAQKKEPLVLIVDDSITVRELLSMTFSKAGYRVEQARDGQEAWEKLRSGLPADLLFCDIEMPKMNGLELLSRMQKEEELAAIPVSLLTSRGAEKHRKMAADLGASGYFTKPYTEKDLLDGAERLLKGDILLAGSSRASAKPKAAKVSPPAIAKPKVEKYAPMVLVIDDSVMIREMLTMTFKNAGYQVEQARDGQEAWEKLRSGLPVDVVFCDIEMPRMNGLELLAHLQEDKELSQIPIAMVTSRGAERHRKMARERGAKGYFTKPYMEDILIKAAKRLINGEVLPDQI